MVPRRKMAHMCRPSKISAYFTQISAFLVYISSPKKSPKKVLKNSDVFLVVHRVSMNALVSPCIVAHPFACPCGLSHALLHTLFRTTSRGRLLCPVYHDTCTQACSHFTTTRKSGVLVNSECKCRGKVVCIGTRPSFCEI
jgi:hypothetical protein